MISITLAQLAEYTKGRLLDAQTSTARIHGVSIDTRSTQPGQLFVPLLGAQTDGHQYLQRAEEAADTSPPMLRINIMMIVFRIPGNVICRIWAKRPRAQG